MSTVVVDDEFKNETPGGLAIGRSERDELLGRTIDRAAIAELAVSRSTRSIFGQVVQTQHREDAAVETLDFWMLSSGAV